MAMVFAVLASLAFLTWLIYRALRRGSVRAHTVAYGIAVVTGIYTYAYFLNMGIPQLVKIVVSIVLGIAFIFAAARIERRQTRQGQEQKR